MIKKLIALALVLGLSMSLTAAPAPTNGSSSNGKSKAPVSQNGFIKTSSQIEAEKKLEAMPKYDGESCGCKLPVPDKAPEQKKGDLKPYDRTK
jgi:hypothetical protein